MILLGSLLVAVVLGIVLWIRERSLKTPKTKFELPLPPYVPLSELKSSDPNESALEKAAAKYGDVFAVRVPLWTSFVFFIGPNASKVYHLLKDEDASLTQGYTLFNHIGAIPEEYIKNSRPENVQLFTKAFSQERYQHFARVIRTVITNYFDTEWNQPYQEVDFFPHVYDMTLDVIIKSFLGTDLSKQELAEFIVYVKELDVEERIKGLQAVIHAQLPQNKKHTAASWEKIKDIAREVVKRRKEKGIVSENSVEFIDFLITNCTNQQGEVDYGYLASLIFGLIFAATSNNFATAAWITFFTLSKPELMAPLYQEQKEYIEMAKDPNADLSHALINKFNFTDMAVRETIRLCASGFAMRRAAQDCVIDNKYVIPKGWFLTLPHSSINHNSQVFKNPFEYNPNRLLTEGKGVGELLAFGAGRHPCIGAKFASMNIKTLVFNLLDRYDIEIPGPVENYIPKEQNMGVFRPPQPVIFKMRRKQAQN